MIPCSFEPLARGHRRIDRDDNPLHRRARFNPALMQRQTVPDGTYRRRLILAKPDVCVAAKVMALIKRAFFLQHARKERIVDVVHPPDNRPLRHDFTTEPLINRIARVTRVPTEPELRTRTVVSMPRMSMGAWSLP